MADTLKVFKNVNVTLADGFTATSIPIHTTGATETIVLKDIQLEIAGLDIRDAGFYKYTCTLEVDGVSQAPSVNLAGNNVGSTPLLMSGSQIVGPNSVVTLEIIAESELTDYGKAQCMYVKRNDSKPTITSFNLASTSPALTGATMVFDNMIGTKKTASGGQTSGYSGGVITSGTPLVTKYFYADGNDLIIVGDDGTLLKEYRWLNDAGTNYNCYGCAADDTYIYGKTSGSSYDFLYRFNHKTMTRAADLSISGTQQEYQTSNKGWVDCHGDYFYYRQSGNSNTTRRVHTTTGVTDTMPYPGNIAQTEFVGGCFNTNVLGKTFLVIHGDTTMGIVSQVTGTTYTQSHGFSSEPTTTAANHVISIAPGIVWINNGSYNENKIVEFNSFDPDGESGNSSYTQHHMEATLNIGQTNEVFIGGKHQGVAPKPRKMSYRLLASGIQSI